MICWFLPLVLERLIIGPIWLAGWLAGLDERIDDCMSE